MAVSTEEQRQETFDMVETMEEWLYDEGDSVVYKEKQAEISMKVDVIKFRVPEISLRDNAVAEACKVLNATTEVEDQTFNKPHITDEKREGVQQKQTDLQRQTTQLRKILLGQIQSKSDRAESSKVVDDGGDGEYDRLRSVKMMKGQGPDSCSLLCCCCWAFWTPPGYRCASFFFKGIVE